MANQDPMTGKWTSDGGGSYDTAYQADAASRVRKGSGGGGGGGGFGAIFLIVVLIGPIIAAKVIGFLWGIFFKLGVVGRVIQSVIVGVVLSVIIISFGLTPLLNKIFPGTAQIGIDPLTPGMLIMLIISLVLVLAVIAVCTLFYFYLVFPVFSKMSIGEFSDLVKFTFMFPWFGLWAYGLLSFMNLPVVGKIMLAIGLITAVVLFIQRTLPYIQEAIANRKEAPKQLVAAIVSVGIIYFGLGFAIIHSISEQKTTASRLQSLVGTTFRATQEFDLYPEADKGSSVIKKINSYDELTITGNFVADPESSIYVFLPVVANGVNGWISWRKFNTPDVIKGTATIIADDVIVIGGGGEDYKVLSSKPLPIGSKVDVVSISRDKKTNEQTAGVFYNGRYIFIKGEGIRLDE